MRKTTTAAALVGAAMFLAAAATAPAHAVVPPPGGGAPGVATLPLPDETGTLALCIGEQAGATNYLYAEGPTYIPSTQTELTVPAGGGIDCRAYPAKPGQYYIAVYKYPKAPCTPDATRGNPAQCYAKVHHIHVSHFAGVVDQNPTGTASLVGPGPGGAYLDTASTAQTPNLNDTSNASGNVAANTNVYGVEYTQPPQDFDDTVIEQQTVLVEVHKGQTTQVAAHTTDHRTIDCWDGFDPDANGNAPVCN